MGLYDCVYIDYPLHIADYIPEKWRSLARLEIVAGGFQTKDLNKSMESYFIDNCGYLFLVDNQWEENGPDIHTKINYHGYIYINTKIDIDEEKNFSLEYKLKYTDGKLVEAEMISPKKEEINELGLYSNI